MDMNRDEEGPKTPFCDIDIKALGWFYQAIEEADKQGTVGQKAASARRWAARFIRDGYWLCDEDERFDMLGQLNEWTETLLASIIRNMTRPVKVT